MATITAGKCGAVDSSSELGWMTARNATTGNNVTNQSTSSNNMQFSAKYTSGGKGSEWYVKRMFLAFNATAYQTGYTITNLKLYYLPTTSTAGSSGAGAKMALVKSTAQGNANADLTTSDINNFDDTVDYAANDGSSDNTWRDLSTLQSVDLNSTAISAITSTGYLKICIMEYLYDYPDTAPTVAGTNIRAYANFSTVPYLSFTATPIGYSKGDINGTTSPEEKLNGVEYANISVVNDWLSFVASTGGTAYTIYYFGNISDLTVGSVLYSDNSGATSLPAGSYGSIVVDNPSVYLFGCNVSSGCSIFTINSSGVVTSASPPCCP